MHKRSKHSAFASLALIAAPLLVATVEGCAPAKAPSALEAKETLDLAPLHDILVGDYAAAKKEALSYRGSNAVKQFVRALALETTGEREAAIETYLTTLERLHEGPKTVRSGKIAWMAASRLSALTEDLGRFDESFQKRIGALANAPGNLGYRAHTHLTAFITRLNDRAEPGANTDKKVRERFGCVTDLVLAGPFGHGARTDVFKSFAPERATGPWPFRWDPDPLRNDTPRVLTTETRRCFVSAKESPRGGIFYAQTFVTVPPDEGAQDLVVYMRSAYGLTIDDHPVFSERRPVDAVHVRLLPGRHRLVVRLGEDKAVLRFLAPSGVPANVVADSNDTRGYQRTAPEVISVGTRRTEISNGAPGEIKVADPADRFLDMYTVSTLPMRGNDASFLAEELVADKGASPIAISFSCAPLRLDETTTSELQKERERTLHTRVLKDDPSLWYSTVWLALDASEKLGPAEFIRELEKAAAMFPREPEVGASLARAYHRQSWRKEAIAALEGLTTRFPRFVPGWSFYLSVLDAIGPRDKAESVAKTLQDLDPNSTVGFERALLARDYSKAEAELRLREKRKPEDETRNEMMLLELLTKSGRTTELRNALARVLKRKPDNVKQRFELADEAWALGNRSAIREQATELALLGASNRSLREARSLLEGFTELESYRVDTQTTISAFEAWEKRGKKMSGSVARVLDYSALWIHPDGSSDMLEHEIQKIQSQEAIQNESEQRYPEGLVLRFRVLKKDGRALEPEWVEGKPTLTMPHLEVGDYIEFEHIVAYENDGSRGRTYAGPRWFFREQDKGYWRSEFVAVSPTKPGLDIEVVGSVPKPKERALNAQFFERRWRVDESPAAPIEPDSVSSIETLPSVRLGWGLNLRTRLERLLDVASDRPPVDPRVRAIAKEIVGSTSATDLLRRAELAYQYVNEKVQDGNESDGRRSLRAKSGSRMAAFVELLRALEIPYEYVTARNAMAPDLGSAMSAADQYDGFLLKLSTKKRAEGVADASGDVWMSMRDKHTPFGYVPQEYRGSDAVRLVEGLPATTVPDVGRKDAISILGKVDLSSGTTEAARFSIAIAYDGSYDISMRNILDQLPAQKRNDFFESRILSRYFPSARIDSLEFDNLADRSKSITVRITGTASNLLRSEGSALELSPIFALHLGRMAALPKRETPLLVGSSSSVRIELALVPPLGHTIEKPVELRLTDKKLSYSESLKATSAGVLLTRDAVLPATRISPAAYPEFSKFVRDADAAMDRDIRFIKRGP